jgi:hypothetical protein
MSYTPTKSQVRAAENLFAAMAYEGTIRPIVEKYETEILARHQFRIAPRWAGTRSGSGAPDEVILDRKLSYLLSEEDFAVYFAECFAARDASGLKVSKPENCPLLEAQHLRVQAEVALFDAMAETPQLAHLKDANSARQDLRQEALDLTLKLLAPFCKDANGILTRIRTPESEVAVGDESPSP